jgi:hypothetical protein
MGTPLKNGRKSGKTFAPLRLRLGWLSYGSTGSFFITIGGPQVHEHSVENHCLPASGTAG